MEDMTFDLRIGALQSNADYYESQSKFTLATMVIETMAVLGEGM